jgi:hypothetical protein
MARQHSGESGYRRAARQTQPAKASHPGKRNPQHRGEHRAAARFKVASADPTARGHREVSGIARGHTISWSFGREHDLSL